MEFSHAEMIMLKLHRRLPGLRMAGGVEPTGGPAADGAAIQKTNQHVGFESGGL
jgi:hypothetical protein